MYHKCLTTGQRAGEGVEVTFVIYFFLDLVRLGLICVGITAAWASYGSYCYSTDPTDPLRVLYGSYESVDPLAEARASACRQQCYWNKDV